MTIAAWTWAASGRRRVRATGVGGASDESEQLVARVAPTTAASAAAARRDNGCRLMGILHVRGLRARVRVLQCFSIGRYASRGKARSRASILDESPHRYDLERTSRHGLERVQLAVVPT